MEITPRQLAKYCHWKDVRKALRYYYRGEWNGGEAILNRIRNAPIRVHKDKKEFLEVKVSSTLDFTQEDFDDIFYVIHTNKYSLSFRRWNELANIPFDEATLQRYKPHELIAHLIYEITWYGDEKEMMKEGRKLMVLKHKAIRELKKKDEKI